MTVMHEGRTLEPGEWPYVIVRPYSGLVVDRAMSRRVAQRRARTLLWDEKCTVDIVFFGVTLERHRFNKQAGFKHQITVFDEEAA